MDNKFSIIEVKTKEQEKDFIYGISHLYDNDEFWVANLDMDMKGIFDPKKNKLHEKGESIRWVAKKDGKVVGRIAAFYNENKAKTHEQLTGGLGFYECIDNADLSKELFDTAVNWLKEHGMEAVDGPINFGENFNYWGLLTEGKVQPTYGMQHHPEYYIKQFEDYGFKTYYNQYSFRVIPTQVSDRVFKIGEWVNKKQRFRAEHLDFKKLDSFAADMTEAFNNIWSSFKKDYTPIDPYEIKKMFLDAKFIIDPKLVWIIYEGEKPVSMAILIPDVNQIIKKIKGKTNFLNMLKMLYYKKTGKITRVRSLVIGVDPNYQKLGIEALIFFKAREYFDNTKYHELEFSWIGDFNLKMLSFIDSLGTERTSTHTTYRYLFDRDKEFKRYPIG